jgi:hypothetical protein
VTLLHELLAAIDSDAPVADVRVGLHWTVLLTADGRAGIANANLMPHEHGSADVEAAGTLIGRSAREVAGWALNGRPVERGIGVAAINALLPLPARADDPVAPGSHLLTDLNAADLLLERAPGKTVVVVGHFPFLPQLEAVAGRLFILERDPAPGEYPASAAAEIVPQADVAAITGSAIVNGTLEELLGLCRPDAYVVVLGPSTPLHPLVLRRGVAAIAGSIVTEPRVCMEYVSQASTYRQLRGVRKMVLLRR